MSAVRLGILASIFCTERTCFPSVILRVLIADRLEDLLVITIDEAHAGACQAFLAGLQKDLVRLFEVAFGSPPIPEEGRKHVTRVQRACFAASLGELDRLRHVWFHLGRKRAVTIILGDKQARPPLAQLASLEKSRLRLLRVLGGAGARCAVVQAELDTRLGVALVTAGLVLPEVSSGAGLRIGWCRRRSSGSCSGLGRCGWSRFGGLLLGARNEQERGYQVSHHLVDPQSNEPYHAEAQLRAVVATSDVWPLCSRTALSAVRTPDRRSESRRI